MALLHVYRYTKKNEISETCQTHLTPSTTPQHHTAITTTPASHHRPPRRLSSSSLQFLSKASPPSSLSPPQAADRTLQPSPTAQPITHRARAHSPPIHSPTLSLRLSLSPQPHRTGVRITSAATGDRSRGPQASTTSSPPSWSATTQPPAGVRV